MAAKRARKDTSGAYGTAQDSPTNIYMRLMEAGALEQLPPKLLHQTGLSALALASWDDPRIVMGVPAAMKMLYGLVCFLDFPGNREIVPLMERAIREHQWVPGPCPR